jgi:hypothetical protein
VVSVFAVPRDYGGANGHGLRSEKSEMVSERNCTNYPRTLVPPGASCRFAEGLPV